MSKQEIFEAFRQYQENIKKLAAVDPWFKSHDPTDTQWPEAERRLALLIKETAALYLKVYG